MSHFGFRNREAIGQVSIKLIHREAREDANFNVMRPIWLSLQAWLLPQPPAPLASLTTSLLMVMRPTTPASACLC